jgi:hypothetical protein
MLSRANFSLEAKEHTKGVAQRVVERNASHRFENSESGGEYYFYNVLWIERKGDIAYRRAAGRVPKAVWEENRLEPSKVVLG